MDPDLSGLSRIFTISSVKSVLLAENLSNISIMREVYIRDADFAGGDFTQTPLAKGEYETCTFKDCNFSDSDLRTCTFTDCVFNSCNLSMALVDRTAFREVQFINCKMLGLRFDTCNEFGLSFSFEGCQLNHASFYKTNVKKTVFKNSQLQETDFAESDLSGAVFDNCNLAQAIFDRTNLEKADLRTAYHYSIDPEINRIKKARFAIWGLPGLLGKYGIEVEK